MTASRAKKSSGLSGFVSFMKRSDAETAVREIDGFSWGGSVLRVGWSKAVPVAAKAAYVGMCCPRCVDGPLYNESATVANPDSRSRSGSPGLQDRSHSPARKRFRSRSRSPYGHRRPGRYSRSSSRENYGRRRSRSRSRSMDRARQRSLGRYRSRSPPDYAKTGVDLDMEKFIRTVALKVKDSGDTFEDLLRDRERQNPLFKFLFDTSVRYFLLYLFLA